MHIDIGQPEADEIEVTTLGPGAASGESIVVHLKDDEWMIIDSCMAGAQILPLQYLSSIGVGYDKVSKVICTHWHSDHIRGLPGVLAMCKNAKFYLAPVGDFKGYLNVVLKAAGVNPVESNVWNTLNDCLDALSSEGGREPTLLTKNSRFLHHDTTADMYVIGPSDEMYNRFHTSLLKINSEKPDRKDIEDLEGNLCSMAFSINFKGQKVLLGGDMETGRPKLNKYNHSLCKDACIAHEKCGWCEAIENGNVFHDEKPYHVVNMPHHSSASSYCPKMWRGCFVDGGPIATTTYFKCAKGEDLPTREMLEIYRSHCRALYTTCDNGRNEEMEEKTKSSLASIDGIEVIEEYEESGSAIVTRWRNADEGWRVWCFGGARLVDDEYMKYYHV